MSREKSLDKRLETNIAQKFNEIKLSDFHQYKPKLVKKNKRKKVENPLNEIDLNLAIEDNYFDKLSEYEEEDDSEDFRAKPQRLF